MHSNNAHPMCALQAFLPSGQSRIDWSFDSCLGLTTVILNKGKGLEEIGMMAFARYMPLVRILIPPSVTAIHEKAFNECSYLTNVRFCDEIDDFVSGKLLRDW
jgi:hypothetical protein